MSRLRQDHNDRETTTTRVYVDTVRILKMLAEAQDMTLADYIDELAKRAAKDDAHRIQSVIEAYTGVRKGK